MFPINLFSVNLFSANLFPINFILFNLICINLIPINLISINFLLLYHLIYFLLNLLIFLRSTCFILSRLGYFGKSRRGLAIRGYIVRLTLDSSIIGLGLFKVTQLLFGIDPCLEEGLGCSITNSLIMVCRLSESLYSLVSPHFLVFD